MRKPFLTSLSYLLPLLLLLTVTATVTFGQARNKDFSELEKVALEELKTTSTPGAVVVIVSGDHVVFAKGFGVANIETGEPVSPDSIFRIGSLTKPFTATVLNQLVDQQKIKLNEPLGTYVTGLNAKLTQITSHQLMSHTSGLRDEGRPFGPHDEAIFASTIRNWTEDYAFTEPGKVFSYSNANYSLAGLLIETVTGKHYADVMNEQLFKPLGMKRTTFRPTEAMTYPLAQGHNPRRNATPVVVRPFTDNVLGWPAGFMFSTGNDLSRFAIAFMNDGTISGKPVLAPALIKRLSEAYAEIPGLDIKYAYGLRVQNRRGVRTLGHGGAIPGFGAEMLMVPEQHFAIIVLTNRSGGRLEKVVETAMDIMLTGLTKTQAPDRTPRTMSEAEMTSYVGVYIHSPRQSQEIVLREGKLFIKDEEELAPLIKIGTNLFLMTQPGAPEPDEVAVVPGQDGRPEFIHINGRAYKKVSLNK